MYRPLKKILPAAISAFLLRLRQILLNDSRHTTSMTSNHLAHFSRLTKKPKVSQHKDFFERSENLEESWKQYLKQELELLTPILDELGFVLEENQIHTQGERYLMRAITTVSGKKLILLGFRKKDNKRVVIKATRDSAGKREISHEKKAREALKNINFAYNTFFSPEEIVFIEKNNFLISIQLFIEQERTFLERPIKEQFFFALKSLKAQESVRASAEKHLRFIKKIFEVKDSKGYLDSFSEFKKNILHHFNKNKNLEKILGEAQQLLHKHQETIQQYCNFLTHTDFVPHNFRIHNGAIYLLDYSSLRFGNKHESWARFLNFMTLYNQDLEKALLDYVRQNRTQEEYLSLKLMRIFRLGEIIWYYTKTLEKSTGDLYKLNNTRVEFWATVLASVLKDETIPIDVVNSYIKKRDILRTKEEKERQINLH